MSIQYDIDGERKLPLSAFHPPTDQFQLDETLFRDRREDYLEKLIDSARVRTYLSVLAGQYPEQ